MSGPRPLRALLKSWRPSPAAAKGELNGDTALAELALAWTAAVGRGVAARSRPFKLQRGTLLVLTASSAWSDELSLLAPRILDALQQSCPGAGVRQLRFRVAGGRSKALFDAMARRNAGAHTASPAAAAKSDRGELAAAAVAADDHLKPDDVGGVIANLRAMQAGLDEDRDRSGWLTCARCAARFHADGVRETLCAPCAEAQRRALESRIERALMQAPWLRFSDLGAHVPQASPQVVDRVRRRLLTRWESELAFAERRLRRGAITTQDRVLAWSYVMLLSRLPQRELGSAVVTDVLGRDWATALLNDQSNTKREAGGPPQQKHTE